MYTRQLNSKNSLTRTRAFKELKALQDIERYYRYDTTIEGQKLHLQYSNQEKQLTVCLLINKRHVFDKLITEYLKDYPNKAL
jgi:hypothetical protein